MFIYSYVRLTLFRDRNTCNNDKKPIMRGFRSYWSTTISCVTECLQICHLPYSRHFSRGPCSETARKRLLHRLTFVAAVRSAQLKILGFPVGGAY